MSTVEQVHGIHAVQALLERHPQRVLRLRVAAGREDARIAKLLALAAAAHCPVERIDGTQLARGAGSGPGAGAGGAGSHQGVLAEVRPQAPWSEQELFAALEHSPRPLLLALDGVQDPHNLGACLRTADACGALAVIVPRDRAAQLNPTVRRVAAGAAETTPVAVVTNLARTLRLLKDAGCWVVGADAAATQDADAVDLGGPVVLVLGAEGSGLRQLTRQHCDLLVRLPSLGAVSSLNVSVAAGMLLYEAVRQRRRAVIATGGSDRA
ncbi:MAG: 23S rRNA (guanosine(2251)-2'-O)-methyltransferase RlmB [Gammaproteobacteria bacterium]|nr:23S rRNA (guanosine(2251)-2'-O)-methyltransferase RlmB [Gammaproteobacteria bacterium]